MGQLDFIRRLLSCFHLAGPPSGPQLFQKQPPTSPQSHSSTRGFDKDVHCGGPHPPTHPPSLSKHCSHTRHFPRSPGKKGPSKPLNLRCALTAALWPAFLRRATISASCLSELLWLPVVSFHGGSGNPSILCSPCSGSAPLESRTRVVHVLWVGEVSILLTHESFYSGQF